VRIAFLGASTTWCGEVSSNEKVWPHLVIAELQRVFPDVRFDYINGGVPGYTVGASLKNLEYRVAPLEPDAIVIYHATNDLSGEMRTLALAAGLIADTAFLKPSWLESRSLLFQLVMKNLAVQRAQEEARQKRGRLEVDPAKIGSGFRKDLAELVRAAKKGTKVVAVATFSTQLRRGQGSEEQLRAAVSALFYMPFMSPVGLVEAYARYNEVIREVAKDTGVLLIDGEEMIPGDSNHFTDTVHFTDAGSEQMATRVTRALLDAPAFRALVGRGS
jgi:lysophospholipase L1-like esterase